MIYFGHVLVTYLSGWIETRSVSTEIRALVYIEADSAAPILGFSESLSLSSLLYSTYPIDWDNHKTFTALNPFDTRHVMRGSNIGIPAYSSVTSIYTTGLHHYKSILQRHYYTTPPTQPTPNLYTQTAKMRHTTPNDPYIIYGRGGAGNIRTFPPLYSLLPPPPTHPPNHPTNHPTPPADHRSTIRTAWRKLSATAPDTTAPLALTTSPESYYAHSKACSVRSGSESESEKSEGEGMGRVRRLVRLVKG